jgi:hypothetical protein
MLVPAFDQAAPGRGAAAKRRRIEDAQTDTGARSADRSIKAASEPVAPWADGKKITPQRCNKIEKDAHGGF